MRHATRTDRSSSLALARLGAALTLASAFVVAGCASKPVANERPAQTSASSEPSTSKNIDPQPTQHQEDQGKTMNKATMITMTAATNQAQAVKDFLTQGRDMVAEGEPQTKVWLGLQREDAPADYAIFDVFDNQAGRDAHFNGEVAAALSQHAGTIIDGGWDDGVVKNVNHYETLATKVPAESTKVAKATRIEIRAAEGQAEALAAFLVQGGKMVDEGEPLTLYWLALRSENDPRNFVIFDAFAGQEGRDAHFGGEVAAALKANADALVEGGWELGVLANVEHYDAFAVK